MSPVVRLSISPAALAAAFAILALPNLVDGQSLRNDALTPLSAYLTSSAEPGAPAWWRVSKDGSEVWVMATPDWLPRTATFDERGLEERLTGAARLVTEQPLWAPGSRTLDIAAMSKAAARLPAGETEAWNPILKPGSISDPTAPFDGCGGAITRQNFDWCWLPYQSQPKQTSYPPLPSPNAFKSSAKFALAAVLDPTTRKALDQIEAGYRDRYHQSLYDLAPSQDGLHSLDVIEGKLEFGPDYEKSTTPSTPVIYNFATEEAIRLALSHRVEIQTIDFGAQSAEVLKGIYLARQPLASQQACASRMLQSISQTDEGRAAAIKAWTQGDPENGAKQTRNLLLCPIPSVDAYLWGRMVFERYSALKALLAQPGKSVAVLWIEPLLIEGGVFQILENEGYSVETPDEL